MNSDEPLVVIVTGSGTGIGKGVAGCFADEGARVVINGRRAEKVDAVVQAINVAGGEAVAAVGDVAEPADARRIVATAVDRWGRVDVLVNNACILTPYEGIGDDHPDEFLDALRINVHGPYLMMRTVLQAMTGRRGKIVNVSSGASNATSGTWTGYKVSKAALNRLSVVAGHQFQESGIDVNCVNVSAVTETFTNAQEIIGDRNPELTELMSKRAAAMDVAPEDNYPIIRWLSSAESDGLWGRLLSWNMSIDDLTRLKSEIMNSTSALRGSFASDEGIGLSAAGIRLRDTGTTRPPPE